VGEKEKVWDPRFGGESRGALGIKFERGKLEEYVK
jgi:hypothetical protein